MLALVGFQLGRERFFERLQGIGRCQKLTRRREGHTRNFFHSALCFRVKNDHSVNFVTKELNTNGVGTVLCAAVGIGKATVGGIDVHNAATQGKLTGAINKIGARIACSDEPTCQSLWLDLLDGVNAEHILF